MAESLLCCLVSGVNNNCTSLETHKQTRVKNITAERDSNYYKLQRLPVSWRIRSILLQVLLLSSGRAKAKARVFVSGARVCVGHMGDSKRRQWDESFV